MPLNFPERTSDVISPWVSSLPNKPALVEAAGSWNYRQLADAIADGSEQKRCFRRSDGVGRLNQLFRTIRPPEQQWCCERCRQTVVESQRAGGGLPGGNPASDRKPARPTA